MIIIIIKSVTAHSLSKLAYDKAFSLDGSPARLVLGAITKTKSNGLFIEMTNTLNRRTFP